jgi:hypothetical protein
MMTPQLFINYKLKSVAHLPWRMMTYKALNTFIDDIFAFVIKMPTMYRIGCFRDDIVFFIFLYQKYVYRVSSDIVDNLIPIEFVCWCFLYDLLKRCQIRRKLLGGEGGVLCRLNGVLFLQNHLQPSPGGSRVPPPCVI